mmetsp:Transcript_44318/g.109739  ORF Transcript_44318/g.109739 Transcript_44318/m.109739 type:complete len:242 (+) Transcript_44318:1973-2698(+)
MLRILLLEHGAERGGDGVVVGDGDGVGLLVQQGGGERDLHPPQLSVDEAEALARLHARLGELLDARDEGVARRPVARGVLVALVARAVVLVLRVPGVELLDGAVELAVAHEASGAAIAAYHVALGVAHARAQSEQRRLPLGGSDVQRIVENGCATLLARVPNDEILIALKAAHAEHQHGVGVGPVRAGQEFVARKVGEARVHVVGCEPLLLFGRRAQLERVYHPHDTDDEPERHQSHRDGL